MWCTARTPLTQLATLPRGSISTFVPANGNSADLGATAGGDMDHHLGIHLLVDAVPTEAVHIDIQSPVDHT